jgi:hypothetical protein
MRLAIVNIAFFASQLGPVAGGAALLVDDAEITASLCLKKVCSDHWSRSAEITCDNAKGLEPPGKDAVYASFPLGPKACVCLCNFIKFYP